MTADHGATTMPARLALLTAPEAGRESDEAVAIGQNR